MRVEKRWLSRLSRNRVTGLRTGDPRRTATHGDTGLFFGTPDVDAVYTHLRAKGIDVKEPKIAPCGMKQLFLLNPDGFGLCFQWKAND